MSDKNNYQNIYDIAENQAGYFTAKQAFEAGYSRPNLLYQTRRGKFIRVYRGVYRLALFPGSPIEDLFLALLRAGPKSVISHESALSVYDLSDVMPGEIHITLPRTSSRRGKGIRYHTKTISDYDITQYEGLRITTVGRTIIDLAESGFEPVQLKKAIEEAINRGFITEDDLLKQAKKKGKRVYNTIRFYLRREKE
jgi:predicted transcriptional regulator of viral defense system